MFKKIISLMLVACMVLALGVTVSAADQGSLYLKATDGKNAGEIYVIVAIKDNPVGVDEDESGAMEEAEYKGMTAFELGVEYNTEKFELSALKKLGKDEGAYTVNKATGKSVWVCAGGLYTVNDDGIAIGVADYDLTQYTFKVKADAITEEDYGKTFEFKFTNISNAAGAEVDFTPATYTIEDTREPIAGLVATAKAVEYTGEVIDPASTIEVNSIEGDVVKVTADKEIKAAGTYTVTAEVSRTGSKKTTVSTEVVVAPKAITATVANATKVYGDADPAFTATAEGLVAGDELAYTFTRAEGEDAGKYAINATATNANYAVTVVPGELTITKKAINVTMADKAMTYGDALPEFTSDAPAGVTIIPTVAEKPNAGTVAITATAESANYDVTVVPGTLTVAKKAITITAQNEFQVQGRGEIAEYKAAKVEGLVEGDEITNIVVGFKGTYADVEGTYATEVKSYDENANYEVTKVDGVYEIKTALPVVVTFGENKKTYGDADGEIVVSGDVDKVTIVRKEAEAAGTYTDAYEVTLKVATDAETGLPYALTVENNVFVIEKKVVTIKAKDEKQNLGKGLLTSFKEAEVIGEVEGDEITDIVVGFKGEYADVEGTFAVEVKSYVASDNYIVNTEEGVYTIKKASGRPSGGGSVVRPATKPEDKEDVKDDETDKPAASANIALKENAKEIKFIEGYEDKTFRPDANATRNDVVSALTALFDVTDVKNAPAFNDTDDAAIKALAAAGVINGYEDGSFKGHNDVTRAEFVKLVAAALKLEAVEGAEANFSDIEGHWAAEWIKTFVGKGYLVGYPDGTFRPEDKITRAEMVVVITRVVGTVDAEAAVNFADVNDAHWAYKYIMNAAK